MKTLKCKVITACVGAAIIVVAAFGYSKLREQAADDSAQSAVAPPMVVVLDSSRLAMTRLDLVKEMNLDKDQVQQEAQHFTSELASILAEYEENGILVLNKSIVLSAPSQFDITALVAERMGLSRDSEAP